MHCNFGGGAALVQGGEDPLGTGGGHMHPHGGVVLEGLLPLENNNSEISAVIKEEVSRWEKSSHVGADTEIDESSMPSLPLSDFF